jgi:hypothetical protein
VVFEPVIPPIQTSLRSTDQGLQQALPFQDQSAEKSVSARVRSVKHDGKRYLQDILWQESLLTVKVSLECQIVAELTTRLREKLPQNSALTRRRNANIILVRFSSTDDVDQLPRQVFPADDDEALLGSAMYISTQRVIDVNLKFG